MTTAKVAVFGEPAGTLCSSGMNLWKAQAELKYIPDYHPYIPAPSVLQRWKADVSSPVLSAGNIHLKRSTPIK